MKKIDERKEIEKRTLPLIEPIGRFTVIFNEIESHLDFALRSMIDPLGSDYDLIFLNSRMTFKEKRRLFYELSKWRIDNFKELKNKTKIREQLEFLYKQLEKASKARNKILHTKWTYWDMHRPEAITKIPHDIINDTVSIEEIKHYIKASWGTYFELQNFTDRLKIGLVVGPRP